MHRIDEKDRLKGGVDAKDVNKYLKRFQPSEVAKGIDVEKEHTNSTALAKEIASDHLGEDPHYYSKLAKIHKESIDVFEFNFHDLLEWDDDVPLGALVQKVKEPEKAKAAPKSGRQLRKERSLANTARRAEIHARQRHLYKLDLMKSGTTGSALDASLAMFDKDADKPRRGVAQLGVERKSHKRLHHGSGLDISPGRDPKAEKYVYPAGAKVPRKGDITAPKPEPVVEPTRAKNAVDNAFKSKKTDPKYSDTVKK